MENPFEIIIQKLNNIEELLRISVNNDKGTLVFTSSMPSVLNLSQASEYVSLSKSAIYKKTSERNIPHFKKGKKLYFKQNELDEWLTSMRISTKAEIEKEANTYLSRQGKYKFRK